MTVTSSGSATVTLPTDEQILITREFDAPKHLVYEAWTTPELVKRWWHANRGEVKSAEIGAMAMGSTTYEWLLDQELAGKDPDERKWPYDIPCWVFTHRQLQAVPGSGVEFTSAHIATVHQEMVGAAEGRNVWIVGGGDLAGQFADAGLLDEVIVSIAPVTLGAGAPLLPRRIELRLDELGRNGDFASARFSVVRPSA